MCEPVAVSRTLMGSPFEIIAYPRGGAAFDSPEALAGAIETAYAEIARVEDLLTEFRESPLAGINSGAGGQPVPVPRELLELLEFALGICRDSGGAFDITFAAVGLLWRTAYRTGQPPSDAQLDAAMKLVDYSRVELDAEAGTVRLPLPGMRIGLGSLGKGYGVDMACRVLSDLGVGNFMVNGAGDIRLRSASAAQRPWRVAIRNPFSEDLLAAGSVELSNGAVVTSGDYEKYFIHRGRKYHHIVDGRTGRARDDISSATVIASTAALANAYAISARALGRDEGAAFLNRRGDAEAVLIARSGKVTRCGFRAEADDGEEETCPN